jgi:diaminohydroxyphosphoribosylaminopyrimidine deaminase/5-amino-6-(5-phosphoribosylamino)uracil reductase
MKMHEKYMQQCLDLALKGLGAVSPNPMVGAVLVYEDRVIGTGYHERYGEAHAEVNCLHSVLEADKSFIAASTLYVSLEPCSHFGKTPPCADLIIANKIKKVIVACLDPNPLVAGRGVEKLEAAGIEVVTHVLEQESRKINKRFIVFHEQKRPYIILKWAVSVEGNFCPSDKSSFWLSNDESKKMVHQWRSAEDAILVGSGTALADNPSLTVREWQGRNPVRVMLDRDLKTPLHFNIYNEEANTIVFNLHKNEERGYVQWIQLPLKNFIEAAMKKMYDLHIQSVIIEGGLDILNQCMSLRYWDEIRVIQSNTSLIDGLKAPKIQEKSLHQQQLKQDLIYYYHNEQNL